MKSLIILGPSGVGKGTVITQLLRRHSLFEFVVSFTTRPARQNEIEGKDYYFITQEQFAQRRIRGQMLESKKVFTNQYGTSRHNYYDILKRGRIPLLDIDVEGMKDITQAIKQQIKQQKTLQLPQVLCLLPPSWIVLEERLKNRGTETLDIISQRVKQNKQQVKEILNLKGQNIHFITNYQYQLTVYGVEVFLSNKFQIFRNSFWATHATKKQF